MATTEIFYVYKAVDPGQPDAGRYLRNFSEACKHAKATFGARGKGETSDGETSWNVKRSGGEVIQVRCRAAHVEMTKQGVCDALNNR